jgi:hypothetical protein
MGKCYVAGLINSVRGKANLRVEKQYSQGVPPVVPETTIYFYQHYTGSRKSRPNGFRHFTGGCFVFTYNHSETAVCLGSKCQRQMLIDC